MKILQQYLGKTIIFSTLIVIAAVLTVQLFVNFVAELHDLGQGDYGPLQAFCYVLLELPQAIYKLFPMAAMLGVMVGLSNLAVHYELMVLRTSGVSVGQIAVITLETVLAMIIIVGLLGVFIAPQLTHLAEKRKISQISAGQAITTQQGTLLKHGNTMIHIQSILPGNRIEGITRYEFSPDHKLIRASYASEAYYHKNDWVLKTISESVFFKDRIEKKYIPEETIKLTLNPSFIRTAEIDPKELSLPKLYKFISYQKANGLHVNEYWLIFWQHLMQPIASLVMVFLVIPCIFGPLRSATLGLRMIVAVAMGFGFYILNSFFGPMSIVYQFPPFLAATLPSLLFLCAGIILVKRVR